MNNLQKHEGTAQLSPNEMSRNIYVVILERDIPDEPYRSGGAIIMETHTAKASLIDAISKARSVHEGYGTTWIGRVEVLTLEQAYALAKDE